MEAVAGAAAVSRADARVTVEAVVTAEIVAGAVMVCATEGAAVFDGRKPKALTGAEVRVLFAPMLAVTFPPVDEGRGLSAPGLDVPAPLPEELDAVVGAFAEFAWGFPPGGLIASAGSSK